MANYILFELIALTLFFGQCTTYTSIHVSEGKGDFGAGEGIGILTVDLSLVLEGCT